MVGILYESNEWSDWKLQHELERQLGEPVAMIDMETSESLDLATGCEALISRVFASAQFRGHLRSLENMDAVLTAARATRVPVINPSESHYYEISKVRAARAMEKAGLRVPRIQAFGTARDLEALATHFQYPCIIKPDCGGRTTYTALIHDAGEMLDFLVGAPLLTFVVEDYIEAQSGFMTRIELAGGENVLAVRRSVAPNGLSSYHEGSVYELYPDCPPHVLDAADRAARILSFAYGSFDIIETANAAAWIIDANSVSNVSEDCTALFGGFDLMAVYGERLGRDVRKIRAGAT